MIGSIRSKTDRGRAAPSNLKGQAYMVEMFTVMIASIIILGAAVTLLGSINTYRMRTDKTLLAAQDAVNALMLTPGFPSDWERNPSSASVVGIAYRRNVIDAAKLDALNQTNYSALMGLERFNISISITSGGLIVYQTGTVDTNSSLAMVERTCAFINGTPCTLRLMVSGG